MIELSRTFSASSYSRRRLIRRPIRRPRRPTKQDKTDKTAYRRTRALIAGLGTALQKRYKKRAIPQTFPSIFSSSLSHLFSPLLSSSLTSMILPESLITRNHRVDFITATTKNGRTDFCTKERFFENILAAKPPAANTRTLKQFAEKHGHIASHGGNATREERRWRVSSPSVFLTACAVSKACAKMSIFRVSKSCVCLSIRLRVLFIKYTFF